MTPDDTLKRLVLEEVIKASREYMIKERVREDLQRMIVTRVVSGEIKDELALKEFWKTLKMAMMTLEMVPFNALAK